MAHAGPRRDPGDPYRVLGVNQDASQQDVTRAYRRAVQHAHPDTRPHDPLAAAARFQALTAAYDLLRDPGRRADYDRSHPAAEPGRRPSQPRPPTQAPRRRGAPFLLLSPPTGQPVWAGPVQIEPPATPPVTSQHGHSASAARCDDPVVILAPLPGWVWGWPW
jgi:hypothetical protein